MKTALSFIRALGRRCLHISVCEGLFKAARVSKGRRRSVPLPAQTLVAFCFIVVRQTGTRWLDTHEASEHVQD